MERRPVILSSTKTIITYLDESNIFKMRLVFLFYIKLENWHMPTGKFAISGLRVFGNANGEKPNTVTHFVVLRTQKDPRSAWIKWAPVTNAYAYNIYMGNAPDKLYNNIMIYGNNDYYYKGMDKDLPYYFQIEAINESGVSQRTQIIKVNEK